MFLWISSEKPSMPMPVDWETELLAAGALGPGLVGNTGNPPPPRPRARAYPVHHLPRGDELLAGQSVNMQCVPSVWDQQLEWSENTDVGEAWVSPAPDPPCLEAPSLVNHPWEEMTAARGPARDRDQGSGPHVGGWASTGILFYDLGLAPSSLWAHEGADQEEHDEPPSFGIL